MSIIHVSKLKINEIGNVRYGSSIFLERNAKLKKFSRDIALNIRVLASTIPVCKLMFSCFLNDFWNDPTEIVA